MTNLISSVAGAGPFPCILADPPWTFETRSSAGKGRSPEQHYDCMNMADIQALPVSAVASRDAWLFLWTTWPHLPAALECMRFWGFEYSGSGFVWAKMQRGSRPDAPLAADRGWDMGLGYTTRKNTEACILGRRGSPVRLSRSVRELVVAPPREHSRKPDEVRARIEAFCPGPRLELFARSPASGWTSWGNETDKFPADTIR